MGIIKVQNYVFSLRFPIVTVQVLSSRSALSKDTMANNIIIKNGNAATMDRVCNIVKPSSEAIIMAAAKAAIKAPQIIFPRLDGVAVPFSLYIPNTNVAELADVTKNVHTKTNITTHVIVPSGYCLSTTNNAVDVEAIASLQVSKFNLIPSVPNTPNQITENPAGNSMTPLTNSPIVLPREIFPINEPVKGAQAIHQAQ